MNCGWFNFGFKSFWKPGKNCFLDFFKNSCKNKALKLLTWPPLVPTPTAWAADLDVENINSSGSSGLLKDVIPLNPRIHPVNAVVPIPVYVIISSSIFNRP